MQRADERKKYLLNENLRWRREKKRQMLGDCKCQGGNFYFIRSRKRLGRVRRMEREKAFKAAHCLFIACHPIMSLLMNWLRNAFLSLPRHRVKVISNVSLNYREIRQRRLVLKWVQS